MIIYVTDNNALISSTNNLPVRADGSVVRQGDDDALANPSFGQTAEVVVSDPPTVPPAWNALDFKRRFTTAEQIAIYTAAKTVVLVQVFIALLDTAAACGVMIHADDPDVIAGINAYEAAGLIATGRAAQILSADASP